MKEQAVIEAAEEEHENAVAKISLSTLASLPGNKEFTVIDVVTAECVYGMNIFRDAFAAFRDVVSLPSLRHSRLSPCIAAAA